MRYQYYVLLMCAVLLLLGLARSHAEGSGSKPTVRELWTLKSTDGRSHEILAMALGSSNNAAVIYVVEGISDQLVNGAEAKADGEYLLWMLDSRGQVLHKEFIAKMPPGGTRPQPCVTILPVPAPREGAIVVGVFDEEFVWSFRCVDKAGKITKTKRLVNEPSAFLSAVLVPTTKSVLLAGQGGFGGSSVWEVGLDSETMWKKTYESHTDMSPKAIQDKVDSQFCGIALTSDQGGFIAVGDFGKLNKFGMGQKSIWLVRCDEAGTILSETTFPGRNPRVRALGLSRFVILYDAGSAWEIDSRVRMVGLDLKQHWEIKAEGAAYLGDGFDISSIPDTDGFVLAGSNIISDKEKNPVKTECRFYQYDAGGKILSSASMPVATETILHSHISCGSGRAYVAIQTKGATPWDLQEAGIFEIPLRKQDQ